MLHPITITNRHHKGPKGEYIGRGSPLGNPYPITQALPRAQAIAKYKIWLQAKMDAQDPTVIKELTRLYVLAEKQPIALECFCYPKPCHGEIIRRALTLASEAQDEA